MACSRLWLRPHESSISPLPLDADLPAQFVGVGPDDFATAFRLGQLPDPERVTCVDRWSRPAPEEDAIASTIRPACSCHIKRSVPDP
jgi:hypothetical protein